MRDRFFGFCAQGTSVFMSFDFCMPWHLTSCSSHFFQHHCRNCGDIFCDKCTHGRIALTADANAQPVRVCDRCMVGVIDWLISLVLNLNVLFFSFPGFYQHVGPIMIRYHIFPLCFPSKFLMCLGQAIHMIIHDLPG